MTYWDVWLEQHPVEVFHKMFTIQRHNKSSDSPYVLYILHIVNIQLPIELQRREIHGNRIIANIRYDRSYVDQAYKR